VTAIPIYVQRRDYAGPINVRVLGDPHLSGHVTIDPGRPAAPNQPAATLFLSASPDAPPGPYTIAMEGSAVINGKSVLHNADLRSLVSQNLAGLPYPPQGLFAHVGVAVTQKPPFTLTAHFDLAEGTRGQAVPLTVRATRAPGFIDEIALSPINLPANVVPALKNIPKGQSESKGQLNAAANAALGAHPVAFTGRSKFQNKDFAVTTQAIPLVLVLPFDLQVESAPVKLVPGGKARIKVTALRAG